MSRSPWRRLAGSLRGRLLIWLLPAACVVGVLASAGTYWAAVRELDVLLDDQLRSVSRQIEINQHGLPAFAGHDGAAPARQLDDADDVVLQLWRDGRLAFTTDPGIVLPPPGAPGLGTLEANGQRWHSYVRESAGTTIRVAQPRTARWDALARIAVHLLWPVLSLLPLLAVALWFGIGYGLRPLRAIAESLRQRHAAHLDPLDAEAVADEVRPLAGAINDLLQRLDASFTLQRHFIADAAHELRTPIMGLSIQAQLLGRAGSEAERLRVIAQIQAGATRLGHLAEQLLTLARLEPQTQAEPFAPVDLAALARSVVGERARLADARRVDLGADASCALMVPGCADTLRVLLNNLVDNAIRYAGAGASIDVRTRRDAGGVPVIEVCDTGPGIPAADRARVFERFYRGSGAQGVAESGSGLGLSIVQRIAEQHRARVVLRDGPCGLGLAVEVRFEGQVPAVVA
ncbi:sensor histidine kinase [Burkholderia gladioli]|uniref:histidine kinase n=1 Tax=Burkholderia gladioli (strain BSR3) TaxID=999541 RepID=F2LKW3_BURGS|nr:ATP-binding protein [Burkholderia gladioli]AEA63009.1 sensor histidine kinase [Burkholderia gladioli BSR3]MBW5284965.1 HAMP domain-containing protein [Burkholderia gladioli]